MSESRIVADQRIMGGVPCIRGTRIPVATVVGLLADGQSVEAILEDYPHLTAEDVRAALDRQGPARPLPRDRVGLGPGPSR